ncbi:MAG: UDP-N-acetylglucosamine 1-carboxyvinyltransferase [Oscillospiraceae bacterium]|nr:UDP-N-acetylglucosamine 1-carboxyvinyltransferase [Oscillospiraceae bacterium]
MKKMLVSGKCSLSGKVGISGAKNAAVAVLPAVILSDEVCRIENIPDISDIEVICKALEKMGASVRTLGLNTLEIDPRRIFTHVADFDFMRRIRASYYFLGALLGRFSEVAVSMPGGCELGLRPIDQHIKGFCVLGAKCELSGGLISFSCKKLVGGNVYFDVVSVGATINVILAAAKADGRTVIENAAKEPHVVDVANFLNSMGADIRGAGTDVIKINGVKRLRGTVYSVIPDQIEAGTFLAAGLATKGDITIENVIPKHLEAITAKLEEIGAKVDIFDDSIRLCVPGGLRACNLKTMPYPGFPTDMQPQFVSLLIGAQGTSIISESVWENRFRYVSELCRMGADIKVDGRVAIINGEKKLKGCTVRAFDLRAGAALIIAALSAEGETTIENINYVERGYENIIDKFSCLGANIKFIESVGTEKIKELAVI